MAGWLDQNYQKKVVKRRPNAARVYSLTRGGPAVGVGAFFGGGRRLPLGALFALRRGLLDAHAGPLLTSKAPQHRTAPQAHRIRTDRSVKRRKCTGNAPHRKRNAHKLTGKKKLRKRK